MFTRKVMFILIKSLFLPSQNWVGREEKPLGRTPNIRLLQSFRREITEASVKMIVAELEKREWVRICFVESISRIVNR